jgi:hypothetical protein
MFGYVEPDDRESSLVPALEVRRGLYFDIPITISQVEGTPPRRSYPLHDSERVADQVLCEDSPGGVLEDVRVRPSPEVANRDPVQLGYPFARSQSPRFYAPSLPFIFGAYPFSVHPTSLILRSLMLLAAGPQTSEGPLLRLSENVNL